MATTEPPPSQPPVNTQPAGATSPASNWKKYRLSGLLLVLLACAAGFEGYGFLLRRQSIERIKSWAGKLPTDAQIQLPDLEQRLSGSPSRLIVDHEGSTRVVYGWPSLIGTYRLRVQVGRGGKVVYVDTEAGATDDFARPFLVSNADGVRIIDVRSVPASHQSPETKVGLVQATRDTFAVPIAPRLPAVLVFPLVDDQRRITPTGPALATIAQYSLAFTPRRRMGIDPYSVNRLLIERDCWLPGTLLDDARIAACLKATGALTAAVTRASPSGKGWSIEIELQRKSHKQPVRITRQAPELNRIPGVIALAIFEHLQADLTPDEKTHVTQPQFTDGQAAENFARLAASDPSNLDPAFHTQLLADNPIWLAAWRIYMEAGALVAGRFAANPERPVICDHPALQICLHVHNPSAAGYLALLKLAPDLRGDPRYYNALYQGAQSLNDEQLIAEVIANWRLEDRSYTSQVTRARILFGLAQATRIPRPQAAPVANSQAIARELFLNAQSELQAALQQNPSGSDVHAELIRVALVLDRPWSEIQEHFLAALAVDPQHARAWRYITDRPTRRWGPRYAAEIYQVAD